MDATFGRISPEDRHHDVLHGDHEAGEAEGRLRRSHSIHPMWFCVEISPRETIRCHRGDATWKIDLNERTLITYLRLKVGEMGSKPPNGGVCATFRRLGMTGGGIAP